METTIHYLTMAISRVILISVAVLLLATGRVLSISLPKPSFATERTSSNHFNKLSTVSNEIMQHEMFKSLPSRIALHSALSLKFNKQEIDRSKFTEKIFGGTKAPKNVQRSIVFVMVFFPPIRDPKICLCLGSFISPRTILSAAHCFYDRRFISKSSTHNASLFNPSVVIVSTVLPIPNDSSESKTVIIKAEAVYVHRKFKINVPQADLAIIKLKKEIKNIQVVQLPTRRTPALWKIKHFWIAGYKTTTNVSALTNYKVHEARTHIRDVTTFCLPRLFDKDATTASISSVRRISSKFICTSNRAAGICPGDSGGPLFDKKRNGKIMQVGVASFLDSAKCGGIDQAAWYVRLSVYANEIRGFHRNHVGPWKKIL